MDKRYDVCVSEKGKDDKTYYTTIGVAFASEKGHISIRLKAHPMGGEMVLFPAKPKEQCAPTAAYHNTKYTSGDEDAPF